MNSGFVVVMGLSIVFIGLICIILVCKLMSLAVGIGEKSQESAAQNQSAASQPQQAVKPQSASEIPSRPELAAAIAAAISEYSGKDISGIRILSIRKL